MTHLKIEYLYVPQFHCHIQ